MIKIDLLLLFGFNVAFKHLRSYHDAVPACSSGTLTNVLPQRNAMPQTQDMTPYPVTVYRHGADLSLCYPLMWNVTLEYTATHFNVLGKIRPGNPSPTLHTPANAQLDAVMVVNSQKLSRKYRTNRVLNPGPVVCESNTLSARPQRLPLICFKTEIKGVDLNQTRSGVGYCQ